MLSEGGRGEFVCVGGATAKGLQPPSTCLVQTAVCTAPSLPRTRTLACTSTLCSASSVACAAFLNFRAPPPACADRGRSETTGHVIFAQEADARLAVEACAVFALNGQLLNIEVVEAKAHVPLPMPAHAQDAASRWVVGGAAATAACDCLSGVHRVVLSKNCPYGAPTAPWPFILCSYPTLAAMQGFRGAAAAFCASDTIMLCTNLTCLQGRKSAGACTSCCLQVSGFQMLSLAALVAQRILPCSSPMQRGCTGQ